MSSPQAHNEQPGHVIERLDEVPALFFSVKVGRDFAQPSGGWTSDRSQATVMTEAEAKTRLDAGLASHAPFCKVVPV